MSALVLLHGFTGGPDSWEAVRARLRATTSIHAPASLGHGDAAEVALDSFVEEVDRLAAGILAETRAPRVLAGYSMGGRLAFGLLARHPALFARVVAIGAHPGLEEARDREARRGEDARWAELLGRGIDAFLSAWEAQPIFATRRRASASAIEAQRRLRLGQSPRGLARSLAACGLGAMPPLLEALSRSDVAIDLVVGEDDAKFLAIARAMCDRLPGSRLRVVPEAGHNVPLEAPAALAGILDEALMEAENV